jgi:hypothetical protein
MLITVYINQKHSKEYNSWDECKFDRVHFTDRTSSNFHISPLACFPSELIWTYGSHRQLVGLLQWVIIPVTRPLSTQDNAHTQKKRQQSGIRTHNPGVCVGQDIPCLRLHGHCDRHWYNSYVKIRCQITI